MDALLEAVLTEEKGETRKTYYIHNLKYDGQYILVWLMERGYTYNEKRMPRTFRSLITDTGVWYSIEITTRVHGKNEVGVNIWDSMKLFPMSEKKIAEAYKLPIRKGEIDYDLYRPEDYVPTDDEIAYVRNDTEIIARALKLIREDGLKQKTLASCALTCYKQMIGKRRFDYWFPKQDIEADDFIRKSYKGGYTYLNPKYAGRELEQLIVLDINSMYPSAMVDYMLPYGYPRLGKGKYERDKQYPLYIQQIRCEFRLKPGKLPSIQLKNNSRFMMTEYIVETKGEPENLWLTTPDIELFFENYEVWDLEYVRYLKFRGQRHMFDDYILHWYSVKLTSKGSKRLSAKLYLNSLYGKLASNPRKRKGIPELVNGTIKLHAGEEEIEDPISTEKAAFITAYCRARIIRYAQQLGDRFVYTDTDSIHFLAPDGKVPEGIPVDDEALGYFKVEATVFWAKYLRPKTYMELVQEEPGERGVMKKLICGCPDKVKEQIGPYNFNPGESFEGKLRYKHVPGGVVLEPTSFTINP